MFQQLKLSNWRQFKNIDIRFHPRLTVLTGANGAGKTTLLHILNRHFGWNLHFISTPKKTKKGVIKFFADFWEKVNDRNPSLSPGQMKIGEIHYRNGQMAILYIPSNVKASYQVEIQGQGTTLGLYIPSHRPVYVYKKVENIPTELNAREQLFQNYLNEQMSRYASGNRSVSPSFRIKESLISLAMFGYGNQVIAPNDEAVTTFEGFQDILKIILPKALGFQRIQINPPEVVLETASGVFSFDAVSGGIAALIDTSWQLYMYSLVHTNEEFVVVIDEPENHLHPELQRSMLPDFIKAFPRAQFIVATHNPFMVSSVPESQVYALTYTPDRTVVSSLLDLENKAGSSNEILRDVLGIPFTMPIWVEERLENLVTRYSGLNINEAELKQMRTDMTALGLEHLFPEAVTRVLGGRK